MNRPSGRKPPAPKRLDPKNQEHAPAGEGDKNLLFVTLLIGGLVLIPATLAVREQAGAAFVPFLIAGAGLILAGLIGLIGLVGPRVVLASISVIVAVCLAGWLIIAVLGATGGGRSTPPSAKLAKSSVYLDQLDSQGFPIATQGLVSIDGRAYRHGIQFHLESSHTGTYSVSVPAGGRKFSTTIGLDDNQEPPELGSGLALTYEVYADSRRVALGHVKGSNRDKTALQADISGASSVELKITADLGHGAATADWGDPKFE